MRIVVANDLEPGAGHAGAGGTEVYVERLVDGLRDRGHEVVVVAGAPGAGRVTDLWDPRARRRVRAAADELDADVVHVHNFARELSPSVLFPGPRPVVHTVHDHHLLDGPVVGAPGSAGLLGAAKRARAVVDRALVRRRADGVVAVSEHLAAGLRERGLPRVTVVPGFVPDATGPPTAPGHDVLFVGRLAVEKRPEVAVRAFAMVADRHPRTVLHLLGDGPERARVAALVEELGLGGRVHLHGTVGAVQVQQHLAAARVVVAPSARESFGLVVAEAMVAGRAVVASDIPAFREQVIDGVEGWVAQRVEDFAAALDEALGDAEEAAGRGRAAARSARGRSTTSAAVQRYLQVYRHSIAHRRDGTVTDPDGTGPALP